VATLSPALDVQSIVSGAIYPTVVGLDQGNSRGQCRRHADLLAGVKWRPVAEHREEDPGKFSCQRRVATAFLRRNSIRSAHIRNPRVSGTLL